MVISISLDGSSPVLFDAKLILRDASFENKTDIIEFFGEGEARMVLVLPWSDETNRDIVFGAIAKGVA